MTAKSAGGGAKAATQKSNPTPESPAAPEPCAPAVSLARLTHELEQARLLAMADAKGASAATSAILGKARLHGLLVERRELTGRGGGPVKTEEVNAHELGRRLAFALRGAAETEETADHAHPGPDAERPDLDTQ